MVILKFEISKIQHYVPNSRRRKNGDKVTDRRDFLIKTGLITTGVAVAANCKVTENGTDETINLLINWCNHMLSGPVATSRMEATVEQSNSIRIAGSPLEGSVNPNYLAIRNPGLGALMGANAFGRTGSASFVLPRGITEVDVITLDSMANYVDPTTMNEYYEKVVNGNLVGRHLAGNQKTDGEFVNCGSNFFNTGFSTINNALNMYFPLETVVRGGNDFDYGCRKNIDGEGNKSWDNKWVAVALNSGYPSRTFTEELFEYLTRSPDLGPGGSQIVICDPEKQFSMKWELLLPELLMQ